MKKLIFFVWSVGFPSNLSMAYSATVMGVKEVRTSAVAGRAKTFRLVARCFMVGFVGISLITAYVLIHRDFTV